VAAREHRRKANDDQAVQIQTLAHAPGDAAQQQQHRQNLWDH